MIIAQISIAPIGKDVSVSKYVKTAIDVFKKYNIKFEINAMATVVEIEDVESLLKVVSEAHRAVLNTGVDRVITELKIDDRRDKNATIRSKLRSLQ
jgi:uncharacterized protein (TIGR00106 family)